MSSTSGRSTRSSARTSSAQSTRSSAYTSSAQSIALAMEQARIDKRNIGEFRKLSVERMGAMLATITAEAYNVAHLGRLGPDAANPGDPGRAVVSDHVRMSVKQLDALRLAIGFRADVQAVLEGIAEHAADAGGDAGNHLEQAREALQRIPLEDFNSDRQLLVAAAQRAHRLAVEAEMQYGKLEALTVLIEQISEAITHRKDLLAKSIHHSTLVYYHSGKTIKKDIFSSRVNREIEFPHMTDCDLGRSLRQ